MTSSPYASAWPVTIPHETLDQAAELGQLGPGPGLQEAGSIGGGPDGAADVVWYRFTLQAPALVHFGISRQDPASSFDGILSLFDSDPNDYLDPDNGDGYHLIEQVDAKSGGGVASIDRPMGQGTYYLAVSGDGNSYFHPMLAGSGLPGTTGGYYLQMSATADAGLATAIGPQVLASDPAAGASLSASPMAIRIDLSGAIDPSTISAGQDVQLLFSPDGQFADDGQPIPLNSVNFSTVVVAPTPPGGDGPIYQGLDELQIFPAAPLAVGDYEVVLDGQGGAAASAMADPQGHALGADAAHPLGQELTIPFQVVGNEGRTDAVEDDTPATAQPLGDLTTAGLVQVAGVIGSDSGPDTGGNPANQVDLYHFRVNGAGDYSLVAQIFAGRIGSPFQGGLSLFRPDPTTGSLVFVAGDMNSYDPVTTTDGFLPPLYSDSLLEVSLTAGDYYIAVADASNTPSPFEDQFYDPTVDPAVMPPTYQAPPFASYGLYDPNVTGSAQNGFSTGPYVLNLLVQPAPAPPHVVSTSIDPGATLTGPPEQLTVTFDQPMNLAQLAFQSFQATATNSTGTVYDTTPAVSIVGSDGTVYFPRFVSYDADTNQATFQMLGALPSASYALHLSGANGLDALGGNPLVGNDRSGDFVVPFSVDAAPRGVSGDPLQYDDQEPNDTSNQPQNLGALFPDELVAGVTITRDFSGDPAAAPHDTADVYEFRILLDRTYFFTMTGASLPGGVAMTMTDAAGQPVPSFTIGDQLQAELAPGTYLLMVGGWDASQAPGVSYQVAMMMATQNDNAPPLIAGPAPAFAIQLAGASSPVTPTPTSTTPTPTPTTPTLTSTTPTPTPPPTVSPPDPSPPTVEGPPSGSPTSGDLSPTATAPAVLALSVPSASPGVAGFYGPVSMSVSALAASPVGGVVAPEAAESSGAMLAQVGVAGASPSVVAGLIAMGTSLHVIATGEDALPPPPGADAAEAAVADATVGDPDWGTLMAMVEGNFRGMASPPADVAVVIEAPAGRIEAAGPTRAVAAEPEAAAGVASSTVAVPAGTRADGPPDESGTGERVRVVLLACTAMAMGAYAQCRGFIRRDGGHGRVRGPARPTIGSLRMAPDAGVGRDGA